MSPQTNTEPVPPGGFGACLLALLAGWVLLALVLGALVAAAGWLVGWW